MARNTYKQDEVLEEPFDVRHLLRASSYIKKYIRQMAVAIVLSGIGGAFGYIAPIIIQRALDTAIPDQNMRLLFFPGGSTSRDLYGECDLYDNKKPDHGGGQPGYDL